MKLTLSLVTIGALFTLAAAKPRPSPTPKPSPTPDYCAYNSPPACCQKFTTASDPNAAFLIREFGIRGTTPSTGVGLTCDAIVTEKDVDACKGYTLCCSDDSHGGLIAVGCSKVKFVF